MRLKTKFEKAGVRYCEIGFDGCLKNRSLSFAHGDKRRFLIGDELEKLVILACIRCHRVIEEWPRSKMREFVSQRIEARKVLLAVWGEVI